MESFAGELESEYTNQIVIENGQQQFMVSYQIKDKEAGNFDNVKINVVKMVQ